MNAVTLRGIAQSIHHGFDAHVKLFYTLRVTATHMYIVRGMMTHARVTATHMYVVHGMMTHARVTATHMYIVRSMMTHARAYGYAQVKSHPKVDEYYKMHNAQA